MNFEKELNKIFLDEFKIEKLENLKLNGRVTLRDKKEIYEEVVGLKSLIGSYSYLSEITTNTEAMLELVKGKDYYENLIDIVEIELLRTKEFILYRLAMLHIVNFMFPDLEIHFFSKDAVLDLLDGNINDEAKTFITQHFDFLDTDFNLKFTLDVKNMNTVILGQIYRENKINLNDLNSKFIYVYHEKHIDKDIYNQDKDILEIIAIGKDLKKSTPMNMTIISDKCIANDLGVTKVNLQDINRIFKEELSTGRRIYQTKLRDFYDDLKALKTKKDLMGDIDSRNITRVEIIQVNELDNDYINDELDKLQLDNQDWNITNVDIKPYQTGFLITVSYKVLVDNENPDYINDIYEKKTKNLVNKFNIEIDNEPSIETYDRPKMYLDFTKAIDYILGKNTGVN